jgi:predicted RNA-binding Zn ribbon-like protein
MNPTAKAQAPKTSGWQPSPELRLVADFINTLELPNGPDMIGTPDMLKRWLEEHKLWPSRCRLSPADVTHAQAVREALRSLLEAKEGGPPSAEASQTLARAARSAHFVLSFEPDGDAQFEPAPGGVDAALGRILAAAARSMFDGSWSRLKACQDERCRYAFFDYSKNRSGRWCNMAVCGNRAKARRYRQHHRPPGRSQSVSRSRSGA